eukprot:TRINITY_DN8092_c0_g1_i1.p1 TRINITY_DN8092_c0_g1~~TRINITY_DN8092_c0_g1_i1.p1  ORF type:complete len:405 (+),score=138.30 TRINITY_DN8092_c0_g1_i1:114-1328(+)
MSVQFVAVSSAPLDQVFRWVRDNLLVAAKPEGGADVIATRDGVAFETRSKELLSEGKYEALIDEFLSLGDLFFHEPRYTTNLLQVVGYLILNVRDAAARSNALERVTKFVTGLGADQLNAKLRLLATLYNTLAAEPKLQQQTLRVLVDVAAAGDKVHLLVPYARGLKMTAFRWGLGKKETLDLYSLFLRTLRPQETKHAEELFVLEREFLALFEGETEEALKTYEADIRGAILRVYREEILRYDVDDLLALNASRHLFAREPALARLFELTLTGDLPEFEKLFQSSGAAFQQHQLSKDSIIENIRIFSVLRLAERSKTLGYADVANALSVPKEQVEEWIFKCIKYDLLVASLDELEETVYVGEIKRFSYAAKDWEALEGRVENVRGFFQKSLDALRSGNLKPSF